ncbi:unnamed protein product [Oncorhynchus mykiss]|uniref:Uncharacterized protein n=1 Tax=Oncorhynchus mykiss TaxID=8022 RepID=A0A060WYB2_ONCMY|nr:unnamed protein product [Oncorhynchus mykiss]
MYHVPPWGNKVSSTGTNTCTAHSRGQGQVKGLLPTVRKQGPLLQQVEEIHLNGCRAKSQVAVGQRILLAVWLISPGVTAGDLATYSVYWLFICYSLSVLLLLAYPQYLLERRIKLITLHQPVMIIIIYFIYSLISTTLLKYLGVWLDCKLSFQTHIKHLQSKIKSRIVFLFHNKASFTHAAKHTLVKLTILLILDFGDVIYKIASSTLLSKLDAVYHSAIRFVTKAQYSTHHCDLYALVGWPTLHSRRQTHWLQSLLGKAPPYLSSLVTIATPTCSTHSSRCISLVTPKANTSFCRLSFQFSAANDWNELQKSLKLESYISL